MEGVTFHSNLAPFSLLSQRGETPTTHYPRLSPPAGPSGRRETINNNHTSHYSARSMSGEKPMDQLHKNEATGGWTRSKNRNEDQLRLFLTGDLYDCSIKVGTAANQMKLFKCHKLILSIASDVFQAMFYGNFNEASKGHDDPIILKGVDPNAFELVMRFIYGDEVTFNNVPLALEVYKFANKMQIISVLPPVEDFLDREMDADNALTIYDLYSTTGNLYNIENFIAILLTATEEALSSDSWLNVSADTVNTVLQMELAMDELDIFKALIRWGKAQVLKDGPKDNTLLRKKVEPFLKLIRFESMESSKAAELCSSTTVLNYEEKTGILLTTVLRDEQRMPAEFAVTKKRSARSNNIVVEVMSNRYKDGYSSKSSVSMYFTVTKSMELLGLEMSHDFIFPHSECILKVAGELVNCKFVLKGGRLFKPKKGSCLLKANVDYKLSISIINNKDRYVFPRYTLHAISKIDDEMVIFRHWTCVPLSKIYFR